MTKRILTALFILGMTATSAFSSNLNDHLRCYKVKDEHRFLANANLFTNPAQAALLPSENGCKIVVNSTEFCVPVKKERLQGFGPHEAPTSTFIGQELENDFLCYKVKCKETLGALPSKLEVEDQFGTRFISGLRTDTVCAPARKRALLGYDAPRVGSAVTAQRLINSAQNSRVLELEVTTETDADFMLLSIIPPILAPAGYSLLSAMEDVAARSCPGGVPVYGESGVGCTQVWALKFSIAPSRCYLDGSFTFALDVGCNSTMPHCDLVDPAEPNVIVSFSVVSDDFCGSE